MIDKAKGRFLSILALTGALALAASPADAVTRKERNTVIGAGVGALAGAVLTDGDIVGTLGGAAAGGVLGNVLTDDDRRGRPHYHRGHRDKRPARYERRQGRYDRDDPRRYRY